MNKAIGIIVLSLIFLLIFVGYFHEITAITQDLGRHLKTGELILATGSVPKTNLYSYTHPTFLFVNHHWLSEVVFYTVHHVGGVTLLLFTTTALVLASWALLVWYALKHKASFLAIAGISLLYIMILFERTDLRPELFSFFLVSVYTCLLYHFRETHTKWLYLLIPLQLLWVNMHIYFLIGIVLVTLFLLDALLVKKTIFHTSTKILGIILCGTILASLCNPNGLSGLLYPFVVFHNYGYAIEENQQLLFLWQLSQKQTILFFFIATIGFFTTLFMTFKQTKPIDWLLGITFTLLGFWAVRNMPLFVFTTFIPAVLACTFLVKTFVSERVQTLLTIVLCVLFVYAISTTMQAKPVGATLSRGASAAADFFLATKIQGPLFNNFDIGSYLDYRLYPIQNVFVDGRPEAYPQAFFSEVYIPMQQSEETFDTIATTYQFNSIFFSHTDQTPWAETFLSFITTHKNWHIVYLDDTVIILVKDSKKNASLITRFEITKESFVLPPLQDTNALYRYAHFFSSVGWHEQEKAVYHALLQQNATNCPVLYHLARVLTQTQDKAAQIYITKYQTQCQ